MFSSCCACTSKKSHKKSPSDEIIVEFVIDNESEGQKQQKQESDNQSNTEDDDKNVQRIHLHSKEDDSDDTHHQHHKATVDVMDITKISSTVSAQDKKVVSQISQSISVVISSGGGGGGGGDGDGDGDDNDDNAQICDKEQQRSSTTAQDDLGFDADDNDSPKLDDPIINSSSNIIDSSDSSKQQNESSSPNINSSSTSSNSNSRSSSSNSNSNSNSQNSQINVPNNNHHHHHQNNNNDSNGGDDEATTSTSNSKNDIISTSPSSSGESNGGGSGGGNDQLRSCLSLRRRSSSNASVKKKVLYRDGHEFIPTTTTIITISGEEQPPETVTPPSSLTEEFIANIQAAVGGGDGGGSGGGGGNGRGVGVCGIGDNGMMDEQMLDDDEVFSDSISPQLPRGDMCTPYPKKKTSIPGLIYLPDWFGEDREMGGILEPPVTPIGRDELALKRHRFFSDLLSAAQAAAEHRVRFNPLGPEIAPQPPADIDCDPDTRPSTAAELHHLVNRLERIVDRLERTVSARELESVNATLNSVIQKTDSEELDSLPLPSPPPSTSAEILIESSVNVIQQQQHNLSSPPQSVVQLLDDSSPPPPPPPLQVPRIYNGESVDLDSLPTVINQICSVVEAELLNQYQKVVKTEEEEEQQQQQEPIADYSPPVSMSVNGYQDILSGPLVQYFDLSKKIGGDVATQAGFVEKAFAAQLQYVTLASTSSKPADAKQADLLKPTSEQISKIQEYREKNRTSTYFNHLSAISESIPALGWVCVAPTPGPHVKEMNDAGQFYTNRVLKDWKDKDTKHVEWARSWIQTLTELQKYIKQYHTTGLVWSGKTDLTSSSAGSGGAPPPPPPGMPPPPPVLPPLGDLSLAAGGNDERSALFAQINQGEDITKSLKKVTSDMQTHKNAALRTGPAPFKAPITAPKPYGKVAAPAASAAKTIEKPPVFERDGKKWIIEYQKSNPSLLVEDAEMNNVVYLFRCEGSTLTVKGKVNGIIVDSCKKCSILFDNLVSSIEFVNCQSVQMQVLGSVPTISIDKTDGCQMYLSDKSLDVEIISSKSSEMNVLIPKGNGDYTEKPVPEQFRTKVNGTSLNTTCVESLG